MSDWKDEVMRLRAEVERLQAENTELRDAGGDLHFYMPMFGTGQAVALSERWRAVAGEQFNGGELQRLTRENARLRQAIRHWADNARTYGAAQEIDIRKIEHAIGPQLTETECAGCYREPGGRCPRCDGA